MKNNAKQNLVILLKERGFRVTPGALSVLEVLSKERKPLTAQEVEEMVGNGKLNRATVYRILEKMKERGVVRHVDFLHGHAHYEMNDGDHHHLVCTSCEVVEELAGCLLEDVSKKVLRQSRKFFGITGHSLEFFGICKKCKNK